MKKDTRLCVYLEGEHIPTRPMATDRPLYVIEGSTPCDCPNCDGHHWRDVGAYTSKAMAKAVLRSGLA